MIEKVLLSSEQKEQVLNVIRLALRGKVSKTQRKIGLIAQLTDEIAKLKKEMDGLNSLASKFFGPSPAIED